MNRRITQAFDAIPRAAFLPDEVQSKASQDRPLAIGYGQTNSQPSTVRRMLGWLDAQIGDRALDVGSGSGWTTALLAHIVGPDGHVDAVEKLPKLVEFGRQNCERLDVTNVTFHGAGRSIGLPGNGIFDRILVSAGAATLPVQLLDQLRLGGIMVIPVRNDIQVIHRQADGTLAVQVHPGFAFVPLVK